MIRNLAEKLPVMTTPLGAHAREAHRIADVPAYVVAATELSRDGGAAHGGRRSAAPRS